MLGSVALLIQYELSGKWREVVACAGFVREQCREYHPSGWNWIRQEKDAQMCWS